MVIITGASPTPVYLAIRDGEATLHPAEHLWGLETLDCERRLHEELGDRRVRVAQCGIAGENLALVANVIHDATRAAGRTGLGAVMGSKRLKAVAVRGTQAPPAADPEAARALGRWFRDHYQETGSAVFSTLGTMRMVRAHQEAGGLPTRNFQEGQFEAFEGLTAEAQMETITVGRETCYGCPIRCKWVVEVDDPAHPVEREYGGPEYETAGAFGHLCGVGDLRLVARANRLCNAYGLDTIGTGATIAFAMECYERGLIGPEQTGGLELRFGNGEAMLAMVDQIAHRRGFGDLLARGSRRAAEAIGQGALRYAVQIKGQEVAHARVPHPPRAGAGLCRLAHRRRPYALRPRLGLYHRGRRRRPEPPGDHRSPPLRRPDRRQGAHGALCDALAGDLQPDGHLLLSLLLAAAGGRAGRRRHRLEHLGDGAVAGRRAGLRHGPRLQRPGGLWPRGRHAAAAPAGAAPRRAQGGKGATREEFARALADLYRLMGWDADTGAPTRAKLEDLGVGWVADLLESS